MVLARCFVSNTTAMLFRNYVKIALRHLSRHRLFTFIHIICLATGITFALVIGVYVYHEQRVNAGLQDVDNQYIIKSQWKIKGMGLDFTTLPPLAKTMREEYPSLVRNYYRYNPVSNVVTAGDKHLKEDMAIGDTTLISMYGLPLVSGTTFKNNSSALITENLALRLFGSAGAVGRTITVENLDNTKQDYSVSGVLKDLPYNSVTYLIGNDSYNVFLPTEGNRYYGGDPSTSWQSVYEIAAVELQPGVTPEQMARPIDQILAKYTADTIRHNLKVELAPVRNYYLKDNNGSVEKMITALSLIAAFIILMAVINFININIGTSTYRLKEIGLRKVFGGEKRQLIFQFLTEAYVLTLLSGGLSLCLYQLLRPVFGRVLHTQLDSLTQFGAAGTGIFLGALALIGLLAGLYPAFILSAAGIIHSVKGKMKGAQGNATFRKILLVAQFTVAIFVFISALTISRQVDYLFHKDLGYSKDRLLVVGAYPKLWDSAGVVHMENVRSGLLQVPEVKNASLAFEVPERRPPAALTYNAGKTSALLPVISADEHYAQTFGLRLLAGTFFNDDGSAFVPNRIVLSESAARSLGFTPAEAIGKQVYTNGQPLTICGVIKDYQYTSLHEAMEPVVFAQVGDFRSYRYLTLKLNTDNMAQAIQAIERKWKEMSPDQPFEYTFMDDKFQNMYRSEVQLQQAAYIATGLSLLIVLLGLFGMVALSMARRIKEMALRKVLGAGVRDIIALFIRDYTVLLLLANFIAWPLAYLFTTQWLENFAYRVGQSAMPYLLVAACFFVTIAVMIAAQSFKTASESPVGNLRSE